MIFIFVVIAITRVSSAKTILVSSPVLLLGTDIGYMGLDPEIMLCNSNW